jgi:hypothetical protein
MAAAQLQHDHRNWLVLWGCYTHTYVAFPLFHAPRGTILIATVPADMVTKMRRQERAAGVQVPPPGVPQDWRGVPDQRSAGEGWQGEPQPTGTADQQAAPAWQDTVDRQAAQNWHAAPDGSEAPGWQPAPGWQDSVDRQAAENWNAAPDGQGTPRWQAAPAWPEMPDGREEQDRPDGTQGWYGRR